MRPLESHYELPDGCSWCCCMPFPVEDLDWPNVEVVGLFHKFQELCSNPSNSSNSVAIMGLGPLFSSSDAFRIPFSWLLLKDQGVVEASSSLMSRVQGDEQWACKQTSLLGCEQRLSCDYLSRRGKHCQCKN